MRRNSVTVEDVNSAAISAKLEKKQKPEKLFLRSSSVGLAPGADGEQSPVSAKSPNRRESIKGHLLKFKAKAGKILEEVQNSKNIEESHGSSFLSQSSEVETTREELSVVDEQAASESSSQQLAGASRKESRDQMRHRIRQNAQKAVERTRGNVQLNRRLARRPTVVIEELVDQNDIEAIDEQIEKTIQIGEKFLSEKRHFEDSDRKNEEFFEKKGDSGENGGAQEQNNARQLFYGRIEQDDSFNHDTLVKYSGVDRNIICGEFINRESLKSAIFRPRREFADESDQVFYEKAEKAKNREKTDRTRKYQQLDVFVDSIHFDHHNLWGKEEITVSKMRNLYFEQILKVHHMAQIEQHHLEVDSIEKSHILEEIHENRLNLEKLWIDIQEIRSAQQFSATTIRYHPEPEHEQEDWMKFGKIDESFPKAGKIPKLEKERINLLNKTSIQLILFFNEIEVSRTDWITFGPFLIPVMRRFEMEICSKTCSSLYFVILEKQGNARIREIGKAHIPLPSENDLEIALHEAVFENEQLFKPIGTSLGTNEVLKENGRILCRAIMESGELRSSEDRKISQISEKEQNLQKAKKFELIPSELVLGRVDFEDEEKKKLEELREDDRIQKKYVHRSAIDAKRIASMEFANMTRRRVMNRRRQVEKKYEELVKEQNIPTLSVALGQLFAPADESRKLKPMRREGGSREEGWNNTVVINIQSASNLPIRDSGQLQPFVVISFGGKRVTTEVAVGRHPNWQYTSKTVMDEGDLDEFIDIRIYDQIIEELDRDDRLHNVIHEQLTSRLIAATKIRFETLTTVSKINSAIKLWLPEYISNYKMSPESSFLKILISTQIPSKYKFDYRQSQHSTESLKILEKCRELEESLRDLFPKRVYRPLVVDINAKSVLCCRYLRPINPPPIIMQESVRLLICQLSARIIASLPRCEPGSHTDIWTTVDQLTTIGVVGGTEEKAILLACWLLHFKMRVWVLIGEKMGEKVGFLLVELENSDKILIDPTDGHIFRNIHDANCGLEKIWAAFDEKNYYANIQIYDNIQQISLNFQKTANWKPLLSTEPLESVQPSLVRYDKLSEDWILELRIGLEREIKLKFDESRSHAIPQWNLVASRQLREILESPNPKNVVEEKIYRLKDAYRIHLHILELPYTSIQECISEVLSTNLHQCPDKNAQFAVSVNIFPYFSHILRIDIAIAVLKPKK